MKLVEALKSASPYKKNWAIWELVFSKMLRSILLVLFRRFDFSSFTLIKLWQPKILLCYSVLLNFIIFDLKMFPTFEYLNITCFIPSWLMGNMNFQKVDVSHWYGDIVGISSYVLTIRLWRYIKKLFRALTLYVLKRKHSFLYQRFSWRDSKSSFW